jgi:hypothetical protein
MAEKIKPVTLEDLEAEYPNHEQYQQEPYEGYRPWWESDEAEEPSPTTPGETPRR